MMRIKDISGQRFGRLVAMSWIRKAGSRGGRQRIFWKCICDCGAESYAILDVLQNGDTLSCGCLQKELFRKRSTTHGMKRHPLYSVWSGMINRCYNENEPQFKNYGGRGIKVCAPWRVSFLAFYSDMGDRPTVRHSLDRIDVDGDYSAGNCRWATTYEQARNKRGNVRVECDGEVICLADAAAKYGINYHTAYCRISRNGWNPENAVKIPAYGKVK